MLLKTIYRIEVCYMIINGFESDTDENNVDQFFPEIEDIQ